MDIGELFRQMARAGVREVSGTPEMEAALEAYIAGVERGSPGFRDRLDGHLYGVEFACGCGAYLSAHRYTGACDNDE